MSKKFTIKNPEVVRVLDISTGHMTQNDAQLLDDSVGEDKQSPVIVYKYEEGYFVYVREHADLDEYREFGFSGAFIDILDYAKGAGFKYVQFDRDGASYTDIPSFSW